MARMSIKDAAQRAAGLFAPVLFITWVVVANAMIGGSRWAFAFGSYLQELSGSGRWFPPVFLFITPVALAALLGLCSRNQKPN
jgi:hypothetical protein